MVRGDFILIYKLDSIPRISHAVPTSSHVKTGPPIVNVESSFSWPVGKEASSSQVVAFQSAAEAKYEEDVATNAAATARNEKGRNAISVMFEIDDLGSGVLMSIGASRCCLLYSAKGQRCCDAVRVEGVVMLIVDHYGGSPNGMFQENVVVFFNLNTSVWLPTCLV